MPRKREQLLFRSELLGPFRNSGHVARSSDTSKKPKILIFI